VPHSRRRPDGPRRTWTTPSAACWSLHRAVATSLVDGFGLWLDFCGAPPSALVLASDQRTDLVVTSVQRPREPIVELSPRKVSQNAIRTGRR
jgi:hypothetical protein